MNNEEIVEFIKLNLLTKNNSINSNSYKKHKAFIDDVVIPKTEFLIGNILISQRIWHLINSEYKIQKCIGGNNVLFITFTEGYKEYCNNSKCICRKSIQIKRVNTFKETYSKRGDAILKKKINTTLERYGVKHAVQSVVFKEKTKQTNLKNYGVEYSSKNDKVKEKKINTTLERYGVENVFQSSIIQETIANTNIRKI